MPVIPEFAVKEQASYQPDRALADPRAMAAPGLALERAGGQVEGLGEALGKIKQFEDYQYTSEQHAAATTKWHDELLTRQEQARQSGDYQGFAGTLRQDLDQDLQQRLANAPSSTAAAHLKRHFAGLTDQITNRASIFEHGMAVQDATANRQTDLEDTAKGLYRDPTRLFDEHARVAGAIGGAQSAGLLNPQQAEKEKRHAGDTLTTAAILGRLEHDPAGAAADFTAGKYDPFLSVEAIEKLKPKISDARAETLGHQFSPVRGRAAADPKPNASDAEADAALAPVIQRESGGRPLIGFGDVDLSKAPLDATGFPIWEGRMGPAGISHAAGLYQFQPDTWRPIARQLGIHDFSAESQTKVARELYRQQGLAPWAASAGGGGGGSSIAGGPSSPDLDKSISAIEAAPGYSDKEKDRAIAVASRDYHHWHQATAQERAQLLNDTQNAVAMLASGRDATIDNAAIRRLLPSEKADELLRAADEAREFGNAKNRVDAASPAELTDIQAKAHGALAEPTDFARKQRYAKAIDAAIDQRQKALDPQTGDPAAYAMMVAPGVQAAWKAVDAQGAGNEAAVQATLAEQERLGVPAENRRALTKAQAAGIVTQIVTTDPGKADMGAALDAMAKSFGDRAWPVVFGDLVKGGMPAEAQILAAIDRPDQAAFRADFQRMLMTVAEKHGTEQMKKAAPHDQVQLIDQSIDGKLDTLRATLWPDVKAFDAWKQGVRDLAYFYAFNGRGGDTALRDAYDGLIARKYDFDGRLRVPKGMLGAVDQAGDLLLGKLKPEQLGDITGNSALTPQQRQERALSAIRRGYWKTNENDTGAVRMAVRDDGLHIPAIVDGKRLEFSFADADKLAAGRPAMVAPPYMGP